MTPSPHLTCLAKLNLCLAELRAINSLPKQTVSTIQRGAAVAKAAAGAIDELNAEQATARLIARLIARVKA